MRAGGTKRRKRGRRGGGEGGRDDGRERRAGALKMCSVLRVPGDEPPRKRRITQLRNGEARDPRRGVGGGGRGAKRGRSGVGAGKEGRRKRGTAMRADPKKNSVAGKKPIPSHTHPPPPPCGGESPCRGARAGRGDGSLPASSGKNERSAAVRASPVTQRELPREEERAGKVIGPR